MATLYNPRIVTDGLVLCLDAANTKSYPGSGTTWFDLSGRGNNGTLTNGPTFSSDNNGILVFDGTNDYATVSSSSLWGFPAPGGTILCWGKIISGSGYTVGYQKGGWEGYLMRPNSITYSGQSGSNDFDIGFTATYNTWYMTTFVVNRVVGNYYFYRNNATLISSKLISHPELSSSSLFIGARGVPDNYFNGNIGQIMFYNRALSASEIQQNFQALRGRYGI